MASVAFLLPGRPAVPAGGYKVVYTYANHLVHAGHTVTIYQSAVLAGSRYTESSTLSRYIVSARAALRRDPRPSWFRVDERVRIFNSVRLTDASIRPCDVVVATAVQTVPVAATTAARQRITGVYFAQGFETWSAPRDFVEHAWRLPLLKVVIAPWLQEKGTELGVDTILVPNAIDPAEFPNGPPIADRRIHVLALVSDQASKRSDLVASVMQKLSARVPEFSAATFGTCARPEGLPAVVQHHRDPPRELLRALYQDARVYLCASDREGWHLPPAEAMSSGGAVVSTKIGGVLAYAADTAVFAPVGDAQSLADATMELLADPTRCQKLATAGLRAIREYGPDHAAEKFATAILGRAR